MKKRTMTARLASLAFVFATCFSHQITTCMEPQDFIQGEFIARKLVATIMIAAGLKILDKREKDRLSQILGLGLVSAGCVEILGKTEDVLTWFGAYAPSFPLQLPPSITTAP
jgi:hypothetical protein